MANEFIARRGLIALEDSQITGSLEITGSITAEEYVGLPSGLVSASAQILTDAGANQILASNSDATAITASGILFRASDSSIGIGVANTSDIDARLHIVGTGTANNREVLFKVNNSNDHDRIEFIDEGSNLPAGLRNNLASYGLGIYANSGPVRLFSGGTGSADTKLRADSGGVEISGSLDVTSTLTIPGFADVSASLAAAVAGGDNLGNHTATQNLNMGNFAITSVGNVDGVDVSTLKSDFDTLEAKTLFSSSNQITGFVDTTGTPANNQVAIFTDSDTIEGDSNITWNGSLLDITGNISASNTIGSVSASIDRMLVNDTLQGNGSGFQFFAFNEDTTKVKFANWYSSNQHQYGMGMLWYETWFGAMEDTNVGNDRERRIGFYLESPEAGATDSVSGETGRHPNNARFYINITGSYVASGGLHVTDANFNVESDGNVEVNGNITVTGTVDGRDLQTDGTKLDGIETSADVTDTANVTAAGALMDSEITNLSQVKSFDSSDYATAAQGTKADTAIQPADTSSFSTATGVEDNADVTDTANVTAAGALMDSEVTSLSLIKGLTAAQISGAFDSVSASLASDIPTNNNELTNGAGYLTTVDISSDTNLVGGTNLTLSGDTMNLDDILILTGVSASGDISASTFKANTGHINSIVIDGYTTLSPFGTLLDIAPDPNWDEVRYGKNGAPQHTFKGVIQADNGINVATNITASSGTVSASVVEAGAYTLQGNLIASMTGGTTVAFGFLNNTPLQIGKGGNPTTIAGPVTASSNISASGDITANTFYGDGSNLTGISSGGAVSAVANGADDRIATFSSTDALNGESALTFDGTKLEINPASTTANAVLFEVSVNGDQRAFIDEDGDASFDGYVTAYGLRMSNDGSQSSPALAFGTDVNTGIYQPSDNQIAIQANGGTAELTISTAGVNVASGDLGVNQTIEHIGDTDTKIDFTTNNISLEAGGTSGLELDSNGSTLPNVKHNVYDTASAELGAAGGAIGDIVKFGGTTTSAGFLYYLKQDGTWGATNASNTSASTGSLAVALGTNSTTDGMLLRGMANLSSGTGGTGNGQPVYLSTAAGRVQGSAPGTSGNVSRLVGHVMNVSNNLIYFNPSNDWIVID